MGLVLKFEEQIVHFCDPNLGVIDTPSLRGYHTLHFFSGFIPDPAGQLKSLAKSSLLDRGTRILYFPGECCPVSICAMKRCFQWVEKLGVRLLTDLVLLIVVLN